ncbi:LysR family transcriptional regulator [Microbacterium sp.]|uniref:LysR family transcriptional regulator n=1 Tax=Microbacterium sp. TaxID=51671 RepID=UPI003A87ED69
MLDLRRLRLLHEFAHRGTVSAVAEALSYSPSTVSHQLAALERDAGVALLVPSGRRLHLTPEGRRLAEVAERMLALEEEARGALRGTGPGAGPVRVAVFQTVTHSVVPRALSLLRERAPDLRVEAAELAPEAGLAALVARRVDLVVAEQYQNYARERVPGLDRVQLGSDEIRLAVPEDSPAADLHDLREAVWVMEPEGTAARTWTVQQCRAAGFEPDVRFEAADLLAHARLIAAGHAVGMLPDLLTLQGAYPLRLRPLPGRPHRDIFTSARLSSRDRVDVQLVRAALRDGMPAGPA